MRVVTTRPEGAGAWTLGLVGRQSERFVSVTLTTQDIECLRVLQPTLAFNGDPVRVRLSIQAYQLGLAYEFDPYFGLSISRVDPLPHQLEAVYDYLLKLARVRFLLADDAGAGKTIMAGLLIRELKLRGLAQRILVVVPGNLSFQWQRELREKFEEKFIVLKGADLREQFGINQWQESDQIITSLDLAKREDVLPGLRQSRWDLVIVDEAHRMSASSVDKKSMRYKLGEDLGERTDHFLMLTATPHKGDPVNFTSFMQLLDPDVYADVRSIREAIARRRAPFYLRRTKEAMVYFPERQEDGTWASKPIFTKRIPPAAAFNIDGDEFTLYRDVTTFVKAQSRAAAEMGDDARARAIGFLMAMYQRRLASSTYSLRHSLENRARRLREALKKATELARFAPPEVPTPEELEEMEDDEGERLEDILAAVMLSQNPKIVHDEIERLDKLAKQAVAVEEAAQEAKLAKLKKIVTGQDADFANWDNAANPAYLKTARALVKAAHGDEAPLVVDPFAGGGSIPLEALRIGCDAFASDLNPVACLINKGLLEDIPRHGPKLAEELRRVGAEIKRQAEAELAEFYPPDPDGARPIAYLWARTVRCEQPNCGCEIPLVRSFWLSKNRNRCALRYKLIGQSGHPPQLEFEIVSPDGEASLQAGTVAGARATCPACRQVLTPERVRAQLSAQCGGADAVFDEHGRRTSGARLLAVVTTHSDSAGRRYRVPGDGDYRAVRRAQQALIRLQGDESTRENGAIPNELIPTTELRRISLPLYGMKHWKEVFTARQLVSLDMLRKAGDVVDNASPAKRAMALAVGRCANALNTICRWHLTRQNLEGAYSRQALGMVWDFCEGNPTSDSTGSLAGALGWITAVIEASATDHVGQIQQGDAATSLQSSDAAHVWFTDPPYYDSVPYSHLSDFVYVWLRRFVRQDMQLGFKPGLTPKDQECVVDRPHRANPSAKDRRFFETKMGDCMREGRRITRPDGIGAVVFAHKTTEGWEALLGGIRDAGWVTTGSWPIATEMGERLNARDTASLATSIHIVCRPRDEDAGVGDWGEIIRELPKRIGDWMERLTGEGIRGADLVFACIGPALELFSKYARVETPDGEEVGLAANDKARGEPARRGFLSYVWEFAGRTALNQVLGSAESRARNGAAGALEEDARLTALFLWTLQATEAAANSKAAKKAAEDEEDDEAGDEDDDAGEDAGAKKGKSQTRRGEKKVGLSLIYDVARRFAQPLGIHLDVWEGRIIETAKGVVRLLPVGERAKQLFGEDGASAVVRRFDSAKKPDPQGMLDFMAEQRAAAVPEVKGRGRKKKDGTEASPESLRAKREATTLDRVHAAMLLQASGATNALRALLEAEVERGPDFLRLVLQLRIADFCR